MGANEPQATPPRPNTSGRPPAGPEPAGIGPQAGRNRNRSSTGNSLPKDDGHILSHPVHQGDAASRPIGSQALRPRPPDHPVIDPASALSLSYGESQGSPPSAQLDRLNCMRHTQPQGSTAQAGATPRCTRRHARAQSTHPASDDPCQDRPSQQARPQPKHHPPSSRTAHSQIKQGQQPSPTPPKAARHQTAPRPASEQMVGKRSPRGPTQRPTQRHPNPGTQPADQPLPTRISQAGSHRPLPHTHPAGP
ncbi:proline-rich protein 2-like [Gouania willdenowi]|uniref:proline-rich protein 2-like n=1 Tax=Gouania willdenowi TaxID=441366 RepID=UPI001056C81E|nr:proline-rich protein 2-like [Gouania willdenowi]